MASEGLRKGLLYTGIVIVLLGVLMIAFAGGGMIVMDAAFLLVGGALIATSVWLGKRGTTA